MTKHKDPSSGIRILVIPSWYPPDGGLFFQHHAEGLVRGGYKADLLVNRVMGISQLVPSQFRYLRRWQVTGLRGTNVIRSFYLKWPGSEERNIRGWARSTLKKIRIYCREYGRPDLILAHSAIWAGYAAYLIRKETGIPYVVAEHRSRFTFLTKHARELLKDSFEPYLNTAYQGAERIVTVSDSLQRTIRNYAGDDKPMLTIPELVFTENFPRPPDRVRDPFIVVSIGRLEKEKGMDMLIDAFELFATDLPDAQLRIIGTGPLEEDLKRRASRTVVADQILFVGQLSQKEVCEELHAAKMMALASRIEAFGIVYIEAMSTGLPVLATRAGGPQTFIPEFAGFLAGRESVPSLYVGLQNIYSQYHRFKPEKISRYVQKHFSRKVVIRKYTNLINSILGPTYEGTPAGRTSMAGK